jgi:hypothetical protein
MFELSLLYFAQNLARRREMPQEFLGAGTLDLGKISEEKIWQPIALFLADLSSRTFLSTQRKLG